MAMTLPMPAIGAQRCLPRTTGRRSIFEPAQLT